MVKTQRHLNPPPVEAAQASPNSNALSDGTFVVPSSADGADGGFYRVLIGSVWEFCWDFIGSV